MFILLNLPTIIVLNHVPNLGRMLDTAEPFSVIQTRQSHQTLGPTWMILGEVGDIVHLVLNDDQ